MKKYITIICLVTIYGKSFSQNIGVGFQATLPSFGISVKYDVTDQHTIQAIYGAFGIVSNISGRYMYNFDENNESSFLGTVKPFLYGQIGVWSYDYSSFGIDVETESSIGFGIGGGLEFNWLSFISNNLKSTLELGFSRVDIQSYNFKATTFGGGIHYHF
tara:strand:- start:97 stop:576 length:480 start_codon:yes stop_codon:yes gene_type:complete